MQKTVILSKFKDDGGRDSETKATRGANPDKSRKAWVYYLDDGSGCNLSVPYPANLNRHPCDMPVEIRYFDRRGKAAPEWMLKARGHDEEERRRPRDENEEVRYFNARVKELGAEVVFSDGTTAWTGYPELYDRTTEEEKDFRLLDKGDGKRPLTAKTASEFLALTHSLRRIASDYSKKHGERLSISVPRDMKELAKWKRDGIEKHLFATDERPIRAAGVVAEVKKVVEKALATMQRNRAAGVTRRHAGTPTEEPATETAKHEPHLKGHHGAKHIEVSDASWTHLTYGGTPYSLIHGGKPTQAAKALKYLDKHGPTDETMLCKKAGSHQDGEKMGVHRLFSQKTQPLRDLITRRPDGKLELSIAPA